MWARLYVGMIALTREFVSTISSRIRGHRRNYVLQNTRGSAGGDAVVGYAPRYHGISANHRSPSNRYARADHDILAQPCSSLDKNRLYLIDSLSPDWDPRIGVLMYMVGDI